MLGTLRRAVTMKFHPDAPSASQQAPRQSSIMGEASLHAEAASTIGYFRDQTRLEASRARHHDVQERTNIPSTIGGVASAHYGNKPDQSGTFAQGGALDEAGQARALIESQFTVSSESERDALDRLVTMLLNVPGREGARYGNAHCLALAFAQATNGDASRARAALFDFLHGIQASYGSTADELNAALRGTKANTSAQPDQQADYGGDLLAAVCALTASERGCELLLERPSALAAISESNRLGAPSTPKERDRALMALKASAHLLANYPLARLGIKRPTTIEGIAVIARHVVEQARASDQAAEESGVAHDVFLRNEIAANALLGALSDAPSIEQLEAKLVFRGEMVEPETLRKTRTRFNRCVGTGKENLKWRERMRSKDELPALDGERLKSLYVMNVMAHISSSLEAELNAPFDRSRANGQSSDPVLVQQFEHRLKVANRLATLMVLSGEVPKHGMREPMTYGRNPENTITKSAAITKITEQAAKLLGMTTEELEACRWWNKDVVPCGSLGIETLREWGIETCEGFADSSLNNRLDVVLGLHNKTIPPIEAMGEMATIVEEGGAIVADSDQEQGQAWTQWTTVAAAAAAWLSRYLLTITPLPTYVNTKGRGSRVMLTGEKTSKGATLRAYVGTFKRHTRIFYKGIVVQWTPGPVLFWGVHERAKPHITESFNGSVMEITGANLEECNKTFQSIFSATRDRSDKSAPDIWRRMVKVAGDNPAISVRYHESERSTPADIKQNMVIVGGNPLPFLHLPEVALPFGSKVSFGKYGPWMAAAYQRHRSVAHGAEIGIDSGVTRLAEGSYEHVTGVRGFLFYPIPSLVLATLLGINLSGGHGAALITDESSRTTQVVKFGNGEINVAEGIARREFAVDPETARLWLANEDGHSVPRPPAEAAGASLPDAERSARGQQGFVLEQELTPEVHARFIELQSLAKHIRAKLPRGANPSESQELQEIGKQILMLVLDESSWGDVKMSTERTDSTRKAYGPRPWGYEYRSIDTTTVRQRQPAELVGPPPRLLTPRELYPEIFVDVQMKKVFIDSKWFVDMVPKGDLTPSQINAAYKTQKTEQDFDLRAFVEAHFEIEVRAGTQYKPDPKMPIMDHINRMWDVLTLMPLETLHEYSSLLRSKHPHVVPSPRFSERYYWDTYFTIRGLLAHAKRLMRQGQVKRANALIDLAAGMAQNLADDLDTRGVPYNGGRTYYQDRSQLPVFALTVMALAEIDPSAPMRYIKQLKKERSFWMDGADKLKPGQQYRRVVMLDDGTLLNRHFSDSAEPREEAFLEDVQTGDEAESLGRPREEMYRNLRAVAEYGQDFNTARLSTDDSLATLNGLDLCSVTLNSVLTMLDDLIAETLGKMGDKKSAAVYESSANARDKAVNKYCWNRRTKTYGDFNWKEGRVSDVIHSEAMVALMAGLAGRWRARKTIKTMQKELVTKAGILTTSFGNDEEQWNHMIWPNQQIFTKEAAAKYENVIGVKGPARKIQDDVMSGFKGTVEGTYLVTGEIEEKWERDGSISTAGEYSGQPESAENASVGTPTGASATANSTGPRRETGFGWSNAAYVEALEHVERRAEEAARRKGVGRLIGRDRPPRSSGSHHGPNNSSGWQNRSKPPVLGKRI